MINANYTQAQSCFGMPVSGRVSTAWTRALPIPMGEVAAVAMGTGVSKHRAANDGTFPGTSVWSPPT